MSYAMKIPAHRTAFPSAHTPTIHDPSERVEDFQRKGDEVGRVGIVFRLLRH